MVNTIIMKLQPQTTRLDFLLSLPQFQNAQTHTYVRYPSIRIWRSIMAITYIIAFGGP